MAPPVETWPAHELPQRVQATVEGRRRKDKIDLEKCELLEMLQYDCQILDGGRSRTAPVICRPVERLFRRCKDRKGGFTVETTAWEGLRGR